MLAQSLSTLHLPSFEPLTDCPFTHSQCGRDFVLLPILRFPFFLHASILTCLATYATLSKGG